MASADLTRINSNIQALNALNALNRVNSKMSMHQLRLATGKRINSAADDAAGFTIASKLKVKSEGLGTALDNIGSAKNLMTVAEGHLTNIQDILGKMKAKAQQAANGTLGADERNAVLNELQEFNAQIDAEVEMATWAGTRLLGSAGTAIAFQIGVGDANSDKLEFDVATNVSGVSGFTSSLLDVTASTGVDTVTWSQLAADNIATGASSISTTASGALIDSMTELSSGHYTITVNTTATASGAATLAIQVLDSDGNAVTLDADGIDGSGTDAQATTLTTTVAAADAGAIDLGVGLQIDLGAITIDEAEAGQAVFSVDYSRAHNVSTQSNSQAYMTKLDTAINNVSDGLSYVGSQINRLTFQEESISVAKTNTDSAYSRIVDADMAWEQLEATKMMILQQTATAMLAQANTAPQSVLSLFG